MLIDKSKIKPADILSIKHIKTTKSHSSTASQSVTSKRFLEIINYIYIYIGKRKIVAVVEEV